MPALVERVAELEWQVENLKAALATRTVIGQATGLIMGATRLPPEPAFQLMVQESQHTNTKLREVAERLVRLASQVPVPAPNREAPKLDATGPAGAGEDIR